MQYLELPIGVLEVPGTRCSTLDHGRYDPYQNTLNKDPTQYHSGPTFETAIFYTRGRIIETMVSKNDLIVPNGVDPTHIDKKCLSASNISLQYKQNRYIELRWGAINI